MKAYKLFRLLKNGDITPLFINKKERLIIGKTYQAEDHPTKGFAHRPGWHCCFKPVAPHLNMVLKTGERRVWAEVEVENTTVYNRPESQGGSWVLADKMTIIKLLPEITGTK
jgi:hypothetical protein